VIWRDSGDWDRFRTLWHDAQAKGLNAIHFLGGQSIELAGDRAISQVKMTISQRGLLEGVLCDVVCTGRFYDFLERRGGRWGLVFRQPVYEKDRADAVDPNEHPAIDRAKLATLPEGYRHLAYLQTQAGMTVSMDMPGRLGAAVERLYARGKAWLAGSDMSEGFS